MNAFIEKKKKLEALKKKKKLKALKKKKIKLLKALQKKKKLEALKKKKLGTNTAAAAAASGYLLSSGNTIPGSGSNIHLVSD